MNVLSLGNKLDCVIDHITDNILDIVGITETWLSNEDEIQHVSGLDNVWTEVTLYIIALEILVEYA